jgi:adenylate cyclase
VTSPSCPYCKGTGYQLSGFAQTPSNRPCLACSVAPTQTDPVVTTECERKFIVLNLDAVLCNGATSLVGKEYVKQSYLSNTGGWTVRLRATLRNDLRPYTESGATNSRFYLTLKHPTSDPATCVELETEITPAQHAAWSAHTGAPLRKVRHTVRHAGQAWVVDVFQDSLAPLILAEIELPSPNTPVTLPPWLGREVTGDRKYSNASLAAEAAGAKPGIQPNPYEQPELEPDAMNSLEVYTRRAGTAMAAHPFWTAGVSFVVGWIFG